MIADDPRRMGKSCKVESDVLFKTKRFVVEQFNGLIKDNVLDECWFRPRWLVKKASMVMAGLISLDATAVDSLVQGKESQRKVSKY